MPAPEPRIDAGDHGLGGDDGREVEHPADRQVDIADDHDEHHGQRQHADEGRAGQLLDQGDGREEVRTQDADDDDQGERGRR